MKIPIDIKTGELKKSKTQDSTIVGIDLGTTNSLVAYIHEGQAQIIRDPQGLQSLVPSIVYFDKNGRVIVGNDAKSHLTDSPERTIRSVKRLMGKSYEDVMGESQKLSYEIVDSGKESLVKIKIDDKFYTPVELSAQILSELKRRAELHLNTSISKAVITVPAYFNDAQRQATRDAGKLAGLDVLRIVNEPTAASLAYGIGLHHESGEKVAVYDLGGGTFDISILQIEDGIFEVLSTHGDTHLGGDDIDQSIITYWSEKNEYLTSYIINSSHRNALLAMAEKAKIHLSENDNFEERFNNNFSLHLSRVELEKLIEPLFQKTMDSCHEALRDAGLQTGNIDKLILVGGSTRIPYIKSRLAHFFGKPPFDSLHPDETVALGAAIQADILAGNRKDVLLLDVTPLSLGIETVGGLMDVIVPRNSKIPSKTARQYTTSVDGQKNLKIAVFQGERNLVANNRKLGEFLLKNIPPMPAGLPKIEIRFILDADGILTVKAEELRSSTKAQIDINPSYGITEEEMARMLLDSIQHAKEDIEVKSLIDTQNEANSVILSTYKFLNQHTEILPPNEAKQMKYLLNQLKELSIGQDKDAIENALKKLNDYAKPFAEMAMNAVIAKALEGKKLE